MAQQHGSNGTCHQKTIFTTGQIAKICKVAPRTVSKWFDSGRLKGYRIPGSQDRRIPREDLVAFLTEHKMPLGGLAEADGLPHVVVRGNPNSDGQIARICEILTDGGFGCDRCESNFDVGVALTPEARSVVIIDFRLAKASELFAEIRASEKCKNVRIIALHESFDSTSHEFEVNERMRVDAEAGEIVELVRRLGARTLK